MQNPYIEEPKQYTYVDQESGIVGQAHDEAGARFLAGAAASEPPPDQPNKTLLVSNVYLHPKPSWQLKGLMSLVMLVLLTAGLLGGGILLNKPVPKPIYQMVTQDVTVAGLQGGAMSGRNVHFTAKVERVAPGAFVFALVSDPKKPMDMVVVLIPALDTVRDGQTVQVWGYDYGLFVAPAGLETLIVAEIVR